MKFLERNVDGVLIDAPCSGLGVLKRNPDAKWNINRDRLTEILDMQEKILQTYAPMVKKGGIIVYATCSILPIENTLQVSKFLDSELGSRFELDSEKTYFSHETGFDGFYCARLIDKMWINRWKVIDLRYDLVSLKSIEKFIFGLTNIH